MVDRGRAGPNAELDGTGAGELLGVQSQPHPGLCGRAGRCAQWTRGRRSRRRRRRRRTPRGLRRRPRGSSRRRRGRRSRPSTPPPVARRAHPGRSAPRASAGDRPRAGGCGGDAAPRRARVRSPTCTPPSSFRPQASPAAGPRPGPRGRVVGGAGGADGAQDAAIGVGRALQPGRRLVGTVAGKDGMGVAVDQPGRHEGAPEVDAARRPAAHRPGRRSRRSRPSRTLDRPGRQSRRRQAAGAGQEHRPIRRRDDR